MNGDLLDFLDALGHRESNNKYDSVNTFGFMGRWQFGKPRLYDMGISIDGWKPFGRRVLAHVSKEEFLRNTALQDSIVIAHVIKLKKAIEKKYSDYFGKEINGIKITLSGLVAGAHLKGMGGVRRFLKGKDNTDAYGTTISSYIKKFGDYDLS